MVKTSLTGTSIAPRMAGVGLTMARVVLADDHTMIIAVMRSLLAEEFDVVAAVGDGDQAVAAVLELIWMS